MNKFLLIINGETYRHGPQGSRIRGTNESISLQNHASKSHIDFINFVQKKFNLLCDIFLCYYTIDEKLDSEFESHYSSHLKYKKKLESLLGEQNLHNLLINSINNEIPVNDYKFFLIIRPDLYLKKYFFEVFRVDDDKIIFAHVNDITDQLGNSYHMYYGVPLVNHQIFYIPKVFYNVFLEKYLLDGHNTYIKSLQNGISIKNIDFFINTYHSSSTSNTWNPIFHQVGREETKFWVDKNFIVNPNNHTPMEIIYDGKYDNLYKNDFIDNFNG